MQILLACAYVHWKINKPTAGKSNVLCHGPDDDDVDMCMLYVIVMN